MSLFKIFAVLLFVIVVVGSHRKKNVDDPFGRIIGGEDALPAEFPWQVSLRKYGAHMCGATIINKQWVVTAAHCPEGWTTFEMTIIAGRLSKKQEEPFEQIINVEKYYQHPGYNNETFKNDISLLKLAKPLNFDTPYVQPANLPLHKKQEFSGYCTVTGWGFISNDGEYPTTLQKASVPLITDKECQDRFKFHTIYDHMICAYSKDHKDACQGDSGGPMTCHGEDGNLYFAGITSWGIDCASIFPGVYTEVSYFLDWIDDTMKQNN